MSCLLKGAKFYNSNEKDVLVQSEDKSVETLLFDGCIVMPSFCDVHVHFREPGFEYKETIKTGSLSALAGGYTDVCTMPNLKPCPDSKENLGLQLGKINSDSDIGIHPYGVITKGQMGEELSDMENLAPDVIAFSDDGHGSCRRSGGPCHDQGRENCRFR